MASDAQETLYRIFAGLAGGSVSGAAASGGVGGAIGSAITAATGEDKSEGGGAARVALNVVKSGMGVVPLVAALFGLFGGDEAESPAPLVKYALPERREFQAGATGSGFAEVDYDQSGMPRLYERRAASRPAGPGAAEDRATAGAAPSITVNVQAMDARSFMDRSNEIAAAVREAMLNLNSINDVVQDL